MKPISVRVKGPSGEAREIGHIVLDSFFSFRTEKKHAFRNGAPTIDLAIKHETACWCLDEQALKGLLERGVRRVVIVGRRTIYEAPLDMFLSPRAFSVNFSRHRPQRALNFIWFSQRPRDKDAENWLRELGLNP